MARGRHVRRGGLRAAFLIGLLAVAAVGVAVAVAALTREGDPSSPQAGPTTRGAPASPTTAAPPPAPRTTAPRSSAPPTESPTPSPSPTKEPRGTLLIHGTGDVVVDPDYIPNLRAFGYDYAWSGVDGLFKRDDLTVINLECTVSNLGDPLAKTFIFRCDPEALDEMLAAGVEVANLGNNHAYDHGPEALVDSVRNLRRAGIAPVGAGRDAAQALAPALFEIN